MNLIRKKIRLISLLTIFIQVTIIFSPVIHNHTWHYLKLFTEIYFDNNDKLNHQDPFADESGICRINDYVRNYNSAPLSEKSDQLRFDFSSIDLKFSLTDNYKYSLIKSFGLRGPPFA
jgi:hypothetical protein